MARYSGGRELQLLDVFELTLSEFTPTDHQRENWTVDRRRKWGSISSVGREALSEMRDEGTKLWATGYSTQRGLHDRVPYDQAKNYEDSLRLIRVDDLTLSVTDDVRVQGTFTYQGLTYKMWVKDVDHEGAYKLKPVGDYALNERYITVSLAGKSPNDNYCYKLIAGII